MLRHTRLVMCLEADPGRLEPHALVRRRDAYHGRCLRPVRLGGSSAGHGAFRVGFSRSLRPVASITAFSHERTSADGNGNHEPAPALGWMNPGGWVGLFGVDEFDCAEPFEWPVDEEDLEREVGLDVGL